MTKNDRQSTILELIENNDIENQQDIVDALNERGFKATQATVSRDIKQLNLVKSAYERDGEKAV